MGTAVFQVLVDEAAGFKEIMELDVIAGIFNIHLIPSKVDAFSFVYISFIVFHFMS
jgi:hypothetical protein